MELQLSLTHQLLPQEEWTKKSDVRCTRTEWPHALLTASMSDGAAADIPSQDQEYLSPIIKAIEQEIAERTDLDSMIISKPKTKAESH